MSSSSQQIFNNSSYTKALDLWCDVPRFDSKFWRKYQPGENVVINSVPSVSEQEITKRKRQIFIVHIYPYIYRITRQRKGLAAAVNGREVVVASLGKAREAARDFITAIRVITR